MTAQLKSFLSPRKVISGSPYTHAGMGLNKGAYYIEGNDEEQFMKLYNDAREKGADLDIVEKHRDQSPIVIDLDFRQDIQDRKYTEDMIIGFLSKVKEQIMEYTEAPDIKFFVMEKGIEARPNKSGGFKDGLHIVCPDIVTKPEVQYIIRNNILEKHMKDIFHDTFTNSYKDIYDEAVIHKNGWFLLGSKKPDEEYPWVVTKVYNKDLETIDNEYSYEDLLSLLSIRNKFECVAIKETKLEEVKAYKESMKKKTEKTSPCVNDEEVNTKSPSSNNTIDFDILHQIVMGLSPKRSYGYDDWKEIVWAIFNVSSQNGYMRQGRELIHEFSKQSPTEYNENDVETFLYKNTKEMDYGLGLGLGTVLLRLQQDNPIMFKAVQKVLNPNKLELQPYAFLEEPMFDFFDGKVRPYSVLKAEFEKIHFKVMRPVMYVESLDDGDFYMRNPTDLRDAFGNLHCLVDDKPTSFVKVWLADPLLRKYDCIEFMPPPLKCPSNVFNMWHGFAIERVETVSSNNIQPFINHLKVLVNYDEHALDYMIKWLADLMQNPGVVNGIAVVFKSGQGSGKNVFFNFIQNIIGKELYYETANPVQDLWSRFSVGRKNRILINVDETSGKDTYPHAEQLKNMLTSPVYNYEQKGVTSVTLKNYNRVVFTTNNATPVKIEEDDRRFVVFQASDDKKGNKAYFDALVAYFDDKTNQKAVFDYLMSIDLSKVDWINDRPKTELYKSIQEASLPIIVTFFKHINENHTTDHKFVLRGMGFFEDFRMFLDRGGFTTYKTNITAFGRDLRPMIHIKDNEYDPKKAFIVKGASKGCITYSFTNMALRQWLEAKQYVQPYSIDDTAV